jgi:hypothetical protein
MNIRGDEVGVTSDRRHDNDSSFLKGEYSTSRPPAFIIRGLSYLSLKFFHTPDLDVSQLEVLMEEI